MEENQKELLSLWMRSGQPAMEQVGNQVLRQLNPNVGGEGRSSQDKMVLLSSAN